MLYIHNITLDGNPFAITHQCSDGILKEGQALCNISGNGSKPYFHIHFQEIVNGIEIDQAHGIFWGKIKHNGIDWGELSPSRINKIVSDGLHSAHFVFTLIVSY